MRVDLVKWSFQIQHNTAQTQVLATVQLQAKARVSNPAGKLLRESDITVTRQESLDIDTWQNSCEYKIDSFLQDTSVEFATKFSMDFDRPLMLRHPPRT